MLINVNNKPKPRKDALEQHIEDITRMSKNPKTGTSVFQDKAFVRVGECLSQDQWDNIFGKK